MADATSKDSSGMLRTTMRVTGILHPWSHEPDRPRDVQLTAGTPWHRSPSGQTIFVCKGGKQVIADDIPRNAL